MPPQSWIRGLRTTLGLNQAQLGELLGVKERTIIRIERGEEVEEPVLRLVTLLGEVRLEDAEGALRTLLLEGPASSRLTYRHEILGHILERIHATAGPGTIRIKDLRVSRWVYWATGERADAAETLSLAVEEGLICRQLRVEAARRGEPRPGSTTDYPYLEQLRPGDHVLLCHHSNPLGWFELREEPSVAIPVPSPVFRFVELTTPVGRRLARASYRLHDGSTPGRRAGRFSCLSVTPVNAPVTPPAPRGRGMRDTMTPFVPSDP